ncbi:cation:proton antiporter subunit C [Maricaulis sp. CAU 1757]
MLDILIDRFNYIPIIVLMMTGLYVVFATGNLVKRLVGLSLFQTSVFLLYITIGKVFGGNPPILAGDGHGGEGDHGGSADAGYASAGGHGDADGHADAAAHDEPMDHEPTSHEVAGLSDAHSVSDTALDPALSATGEVLYSNPLPHVLILTAIVVGVATLAVGLALVVRIREAYGTIEDDALNAADYSLETGNVD